MTKAANSVKENRDKMKTGNRQEMRYLIFYGISLLLSLIIVIISTTVFVVVIYLEGSVTSDFFYLFIGIIAANLAISGISLRGVIRSYPLLLPESRERRIFVMPGSDHDPRKDAETSGVKLSRDYFTESELEIIDLLKGNRNRMLQSSIVASSRTSKASISRAISSLENKGVVIKIRKGVTNEIILSETYFR